MVKKYYYTTWKIPKHWNDLIEAWREKHKEALELRGVDSNSGAVLFILSLVMEKESLMDPFDSTLWEGVRLKAQAS